MTGLRQCGGGAGAVILIGKEGGGVGVRREAGLRWVCGTADALLHHPIAATADSSCVRSDPHAHRLRQSPCIIRTGPDLGQVANRTDRGNWKSRVADGGGETSEYAK